MRGRGGRHRRGRRGGRQGAGRSRLRGGLRGGGQHHRRDAFTGSSLQAHSTSIEARSPSATRRCPSSWGRLVGGSTAINTGSCFRTPPWVLDRWCEELDTDDLSPEAMRPRFERVERALSVEPADRASVGPIADIMARGCDALG
ncbi:MAG: GMC family oxidoreductase N-terminal domain-containing protein [Sandaracinaceae bacterium]|nr:GMC family oxidoreductase N-terminal domain-containing protein [Sandaracinaceae bacterium]